MMFAIKLFDHWASDWSYSKVPFYFSCSHITVGSTAESQAYQSSNPRTLSVCLIGSILPVCSSCSGCNYCYFQRCLHFPTSFMLAIWWNLEWSFGFVISRSRSGCRLWFQTCRLAAYRPCDLDSPFDSDSLYLMQRHSSHFCFFCLLNLFTLSSWDKNHACCNVFYLEVGFWVFGYPWNLLYTVHDFAVCSWSVIGRLSCLKIFAGCPRRAPYWLFCSFRCHRACPSACGKFGSTGSRLCSSIEYALVASRETESVAKFSVDQFESAIANAGTNRTKNRRSDRSSTRCSGLCFIANSSRVLWTRKSANRCRLLSAI